MVTKLSVTEKEAEEYLLNNPVYLGLLVASNPTADWL
jgi:hypothetical protein